MSDDQNNSNEQQPAETISVVSPGAILSVARQARNLSLEQVAKELFMAVSKLQALEEDQFEQFNSPIFVRGYLRSYAKLLKIDGDQVVAAFDQMLSARAPKMATAEMRSIPENPQKHLWFFVAVIAGIFFVIYMISIWFFDNGKTSQMKSLSVTDSTLAPSIDNLPAPDSVAVASSSSAMSSVASSIPSTVLVAPIISSAKSDSSKMFASSSVQNFASVASSRASIAAQISPSIVQNSNLAQSSKSSIVASTNAVSKNQRLDEISFSFREESWLEVSDSRGDVLATELQSAGSHLSLTGVAPFDVKLGNSPGVDVKINGKKYPITPLITSKVLILKVVN